MKAERGTLALLLWLGTTIITVASGSRAAEPDRTIDWSAFLARHDMHFDKLPSQWTAAPHFGNAAIGSMLYKNGNTIQLQVFRNDVHDHRDAAPCGVGPQPRQRADARQQYRPQRKNRPVADRESPRQGRDVG